METNHPSSPYQLFMLVLSVLAIGMLAIGAIVPFDTGTRQILEHADTAVCVLFFLDFLLNLYRAKDRKHYLLTWGILDLVSSVPAIGVLRTARLGRIARILRVLRTVRAAHVLSTFILERRAQSGVFAAALISILLVVTGSIAIHHFEITPDSTIKTPNDAVWWALTTITTVGYGDTYPTTTEGRIVAVVLMFGGVGLFGTLSGFIAAWFMGTSQGQQDTELARIRSELAEIKALIATRAGASET